MTTELDSAQNLHKIDPLFREKCNLILHEWQEGDLPYREASKKLESFIVESKEDDNVAHEGGVHIIYGIIKAYRGDYEGSIQHFERANGFFQIAKNADRILTCTLNIGETYRQMGSYAQARIYFRKAYNQAKEINNSGTQCIAISNEGLMWLSLGNLELALSCMQEGLNLSRNPWSDRSDDEVARKSHDCEVYHGLTMLKLKQNDYKSAWHYATQAYFIAEELERPLRVGYANRAMAEVISVTGKALESGFDNDPDEYYLRAVHAFREMKADAEVAHTIYAQGKSLSKRGKKDLAIRSFRKAMLIYSKLKMISSAAKAAEAQVNVS